MRSFYSKDEMLLAVAKKKPRLQALIDRVADMSEGDIDVLSEPLWVREALKTLKLSDGKGQKERLQDILDAADKADAEAAKIPQKTYEVRIWDANDEFIGTDAHNGNGWKIELKAGDSFLIVDDQLVRFGDSTLKVDEWNRYPLMQGSNFVGYMTLELYKGFNRALLNQKHKI